MTSKKFVASGAYELRGGCFDGSSYELLERRVIACETADGTIVALWKAEDEYLRSIGKDPATLTAGERKTLLFPFRYGSSLPRL